MRILKSIRNFSFILLIFIVIGCESSTGPEFSESDAYFHIGDTWQYFRQSDNIYSQEEVVGKTERTDGQEVYIIEYSTKVGSEVYFDSTYAFIRSGFYYSTFLTKISEPDYKDVNPFYEFKNYKIEFKDGENWTGAVGSPDSLSINYKVEKIGNMTTPAGGFDDVFCVNGFVKFYQDSFSIYYSQKYGKLGSSYKNADTELVYLKRNNKEFGSKMEF